MGDVYHVTLYPEGNFETQTSIFNDNFTITARTYVEGYTYFTIKINDTHHLCVMALARLGVNLCYAPILTIDNKRHIFYLKSSQSDITTVDYRYFNKEINMYYFQSPATYVVESVVI